VRVAHERPREPPDERVVRHERVEIGPMCQGVPLPWGWYPCA
jgi:hypothetical protein